MTKQRSSEQWRELLEQQLQSGLSVTQFCLEHGITKSNFYLKRKMFRDTHNNLSTFVEARPSDQLTDTAMTLEYGQCQLTLDNSVDTAWLAALMKSLS